MRKDIRNCKMYGGMQKTATSPAWALKATSTSNDEVSALAFGCLATEWNHNVSGAGAGGVDEAWVDWIQSAYLQGPGSTRRGHTRGCH